MATLFASLMAVFLAVFSMPAKAALVTVDLLTDSQTAISNGPVVANTLQQGLGQLPGTASFIGSRTISAELTGGPTPVLVIANVGGGNFTCDRSIGTLGVCDLIYTTDESLTINRVLLGASTDLTGVGNATLSLYINGAVVPTWTHVMASANENYDISFGLTTFAPGSSFDLRSSGTTAAVDFSAYSLVVDQQREVSVPGSLALIGGGIFGLGFATKRRRSANDKSVALAA